MIQKIVAMILLANYLEDSYIDFNFESFFKT